MADEPNLAHVGPGPGNALVPQASAVVAQISKSSKEMAAYIKAARIDLAAMRKDAEAMSRSLGVGGANAYGKSSPGNNLGLATMPTPQASARPSINVNYSTGTGYRTIPTQAGAGGGVPPLGTSGAQFSIAPPSPGVGLATVPGTALSGGGGTPPPSTPGANPLGTGTPRSTWQTPPTQNGGSGRNLLGGAMALTGFYGAQALLGMAGQNMDYMTADLVSNRATVFSGMPYSRAATERTRNQWTSLTYGGADSATDVYGAANTFMGMGYTNNTQMMNQGLTGANLMSQLTGTSLSQSAQGMQGFYQPNAFWAAQSLGISTRDSKGNDMPITSIVNQLWARTAMHGNMTPEQVNNAFRPGGALAVNPLITNLGPEGADQVRQLMLARATTNKPLPMLNSDKDITAYLGTTGLTDTSRGVQQGLASAQARRTGEYTDAWRTGYDTTTKGLTGFNNELADATGALKDFTNAMTAISGGAAGLRGTSGGSAMLGAGSSILGNLAFGAVMARGMGGARVMTGGPGGGIVGKSLGKVGLGGVAAKMSSSGFKMGGGAAVAGMGVGMAGDAFTTPGSGANKAFDVAGTTLTWGGTGAMTGSFLGPRGAAIGGIAGGIAGLGMSLWKNLRGENSSSSVTGAAPVYTDEMYTNAMSEIDRQQKTYAVQLEAGGMPRDKAVNEAAKQAEESKKFWELLKQQYGGRSGGTTQRTNAASKWSSVTGSNIGSDSDSTLTKVGNAIQGGPMGIITGAASGAGGWLVSKVLGNNNNVSVGQGNMPAQAMDGMGQYGRKSMGDTKAKIMQDPVGVTGAGAGASGGRSGTDQVQQDGQTDETTPGGGGASVSSMIAFAKSWIGTPYSWGGGGLNGPSYGIGQGAHIYGFDCSGFTQCCYGHAGVILPRVSRDQAGRGTAVNQDAAAPGDLLAIAWHGGGVDHVGIYLGGGQMINSPHTGAYVRIEAVPWSAVVTVRRLLAGGTGTGGGGSQNPGVGQTPTNAGGLIPQDVAGLVLSMGSGGPVAWAGWEGGSNNGDQYEGGATGGGSQYAGGVMTPRQVADTAKSQGFTGYQIVQATAIASKESAYNPMAHNPNPPDDSYGLWQINMIGAMGPERRRQYGLKTNDELYNPATNARVARGISGGGSNWNPWSTHGILNDADYMASIQRQIGSYADGKWRTQDEVARLHEGEMVLPKQLATTMREAIAGGFSGMKASTGNKTVQIYVQSDGSQGSARDLANEVVRIMADDHDYEMMRTG